MSCCLDVVAPPHSSSPRRERCPAEEPSSDVQPATLRLAWTPERQPGGAPVTLRSAKLPRWLCPVAVGRTAGRGPGACRVGALFTG